MGVLEGKVALITGAGRGLGREEALAFAKEGCNLVINDLGAGFDGAGEATKVADDVAAECEALGVKAVGNYDSVVDFDKAKGMIDQAVSEFGKIDIIVNNAGILRDRMIVNMSEAEFDAVIGVHLKGTWNLMRHGCAYFREIVKADPKLKFPGRIINTSSDAGLLGNMGQTNYGAAKAGIAAMANIAAAEMKRGKYATINTIVPVARTRLTTDATPNFVEIMNKLDESGFDVFNPANIAPMVVYLASDKASRISGEVFRVVADRIWIYQGWHTWNDISNEGKTFTQNDLAEKVKGLMKGAPKKETLMDAIGSLIKM